jgi:hypothetical protein
VDREHTLSSPRAGISRHPLHSQGSPLGSQMAQTCSAAADRLRARSEAGVRRADRDRGRDLTRAKCAQIVRRSGWSQGGSANWPEKDPACLSCSTCLYSIQHEEGCSNDGAVAKALDCFAPVAKVGCSTQAAAILLKVTTAYRVFMHRSPIIPTHSTAPDYRCWGIKMCGSAGVEHPTFAT